ncbi:ferrochelatase [Sphingopyxis sp. RIFCSPHIGHO2_12_FULL_65_19]|uniref:ferrochelatase n=1 Tax=Sphingopyxis sp. RIFCSPHIGHO2_12_FULL_65_19 TaxID=1802172 RepID=UPI0008D249C4|nr:ferrochelatase [Sphingopyxis sp. RIFCSPHIGHO2_12_FULL_65_19]OHD07089.1 MAG: ferrochelatase [Sphingopyxis sp. RIFCSPHIGHO2_12_FULL_65_19]
MTRPPDHPPVATPRIGILLVNLGTPDAPDAPSVRRYLGEFLSDRRVVEIPQILWQPILRGIILTTRPKKSAHAYQQIWTDKGSPLAAITQAQAQGLQAALGEAAVVSHAMRYGNPAIGPAIDALMAAGCRRILIAPLYPQYCAATTATVVDAVGQHLASLRWQPALRFLPPYHDDPAYLAALKQSVEAGLARLDFVPDVLLASFHGMPERTLHLGDPYHCQCQKTARLLSEALGRPVDVAFQSRFGRAKWLEPATDTRLEQLGREGRSVAILAPGFAADCLETREELAIRGKEQFAGAGGGRFAYIDCLNADAPGQMMIETLVRRELAGWL